MKFSALFEAEVKGDLHNLTHEVLSHHGMKAGSGMNPDAPKNKYIKYGGVADEKALAGDVASLGWQEKPRKPGFGDPNTTLYGHPSSPDSELHITHWTSPMTRPGDLPPEKISTAGLDGFGHRRLN